MSPSQPAVIRRFTQLDVFTPHPMFGNPLAVVHDAQGLDDESMRRFARWTNLSETTFLLPSTDALADYRVRIFTPDRELPFAGHPTLGSCHAWLAAGGVPRDDGQVVQQCAIGRVVVRRDGTRLAFAAPPRVRTGPVDANVRARVAQALRIDVASMLDVEWVCNGPMWLAVRLATRDQLLALQPDFAAFGDLEIGVVAPCPPGGEAQFELRAFVPTHGVNEDPVTGSLNASVAQWLIEAGLAPARYTAAQGTALGRAGRVHVSADGGQVWVGGDVAGCIEGTVRL